MKNPSIVRVIQVVSYRVVAALLLIALGAWMSSFLLLGLALVICLSVVVITRILSKDGYSSDRLAMSGLLGIFNIALVLAISTIKLFMLL